MALDPSSLVGADQIIFEPFGVVRGMYGSFRGYNMVLELSGVV